MQDHLKAAIAEIELTEGVAINLAHLVREMERATTRCRKPVDTVNWDCEDVAFVGLNGTRILLAVVEPDERHALQRLFLSVGPSPDALRPTPLSRRHVGLARVMVERIRQRIGLYRVTWHNLRGIVDADAIDLLADGETPNLALPNEAPRTLHRPDGHELAAAERDLSQRLHAARAAIYTIEAPVEEEPSGQLRLATHLMNGALLVTALPVGGALMAYGVLRGKADATLTARALGLVGAMTSAAQAGVIG